MGVECLKLLAPNLGTSGGDEPKLPWSKIHVGLRVFPKVVAGSGRVKLGELLVLFGFMDD